MDAPVSSLRMHAAGVSSRGQGLSEIITIKGPRIDTRDDGAALRERIYRAIVDAGVAVVGARTLEAINHEAADACFGVLARDHGIEWVAERVLIPDVPDHVLTIIAEAMQRRREEAA